MLIFLDPSISAPVLQPEIEEWSSWDEDAPTSIKIEGGNGAVPPQQDEDEEAEPDYFKDMAPTIRKTQKVRLHAEWWHFINITWVLLLVYPCEWFAKKLAVSYEEGAARCRFEFLII